MINLDKETMIALLSKEQKQAIASAYYDKIMKAISKMQIKSIDLTPHVTKKLVRALDSIYWNTGSSDDNKINKEFSGFILDQIKALRK